MKLNKLVTAIILAAIAVAVAVHVSKAQDQDKAAITAILEAQKNAWNNGNLDEFLKGYRKSEYLTFSGSNGVVRGFDAVRERYKKSYPDRDAMGRLDFPEIEITILGSSKDAALVLGKWHLTREQGEVGGVYSLVFQKINGNWLIVHDHTSVVPPAH